MTNLDAALKYLSKGWPVIPISPINKRPCIQSWKRYQNWLPFEKEIREWWENYPDANIGLITGKISGVSVVDVDPRHNGTTERLPETVKAQTGGGGWHYFYKYNPDVYSRNGLKEGVDLKSDGGYVILAPSIHSSGNKYKWITPPFVNEFAPLPQWVIESLTTKKESKFDIKSLEGVGEGQRNATAASIAGKMLHNATEQDLPTIWELFKTWNDKNTPPMGEQELKAVFDSIWSKENLRTKDTLLKTPVTTPSIDINRVFEPILAKNLKTLLNIEVEWVVEGLLAKNYLTLFAAREKMGKTTLVKALIKSLATGEKFLGQGVKQSKVLVITEEHAGHWSRRLEDMGLTDCETVWFIPQPFNTRLKQKEWSDYLINSVAPYCKQNLIEVLIIDTISPIWPVIDENNAAEVQSALLPLLSITKLGIAVLPLHHYSKAGGIRGSTAIAATPDILLNFSKPQGDEDTSRRLLKCVGRFEETPEQLLLDYKDGDYILLGTPQNVARQEKHTQVKQVLENFDSGATLQELLENWSVDGKRPSRSMLRIYINDLLLARQIYQIGEKEIKGGKALVYSLNPVNDINYQGLGIYAKNEANNPVNHDIGANKKTGFIKKKEADNGPWLED